MMRILVITDVPFTATEPAAIRQLLDEGVERVHLRKPDASEEALRRLIEALPAESYPRLTLQDRLPLAVEYGLGGVHLNRRNAAVPAGFRGLVSRSCHTLDEIAAHPACDYLFLSPLFDSISKSGYRAAFTDGELRDAAARAEEPDRGHCGCKTDCGARGCGGRDEYRRDFPFGGGSGYGRGAAQPHVL